MNLGRGSADSDQPIVVPALTPPELVVSCKLLLTKKAAGGEHDGTGRDPVGHRAAGREAPAPRWWASGSGGAPVLASCWATARSSPTPTTCAATRSRSPSPTGGPPRAPSPGTTSTATWPSSRWTPRVAPALPWADGAGPSVGQPVFALANPGGRGLRVTFGFVSGVERTFRGPRGRRISGSLEHTAPLLPGSSGGPVLDGDGRLLGINTNRLGEGFYLAIPADATLRGRVDALGSRRVGQPAEAGRVHRSRPRRPATAARRRPARAGRRADPRGHRGQPGGAGRPGRRRPDRDGRRPARRDIDDLLDAAPGGAAAAPSSWAWSAAPRSAPSRSRSRHRRDGVTPGR